MQSANASEPQHIVATHLPGVDERSRPTVERLIDLILGVLPDTQHERKGSAHLHSRGRLAPADRRDLAHKKAAKLVIHTDERCWKRRSCSASLTENQYFRRWIPSRTSMRSNSGQVRMNSQYSSSVQKPITRSTPARLYHERSKRTISPAPGICAT